MHVALGRPDGHPGRPRDLLVREAEDVAQHHDRTLVGGEPAERLGEIARKVAEQSGTREIRVLDGRLVAREKRLRRARAMSRLGVAARVDDEPVQPGRELGVAAKLAEARAELHERVLSGVAGVLEIAHELRGQAVHARGVPLDEDVEGGSVPRLRLRDEREVAELSVRDENRDGHALFRQTECGHGRLHGGVSVDPVGGPETSVADSVSPEAVEPLLRGGFGRPYLFRERCESSQALVEADMDEGALAVCDEQTAGRGRLGRCWVAPPGTAILCSLLLRPPPERRASELSLVGGVAAALTVERALGLASQIKWPNDVMVNRRKVAGVLAEARDGAVVLGIGLNVNQRRDELPPETTVPPASLLTIDAVRRARAPLLAELVLELERAYKQWAAGGINALYEELGPRDFLRNRKVYVDGDAGYAVAVDREGRLEVDFGGERRLVESGEVRYER